jgi:hypothetical protein
MTTLSDRILLYLHDHPEGVDDDALAQALDVAHRAAVNQVCHRLEQEGRVVRGRAHGKIRNYLGRELPPTAETTLPVAVPGERPWYWEGLVQSRVEQWLLEHGYRILRTANTATKERGKDIEAHRDGIPMWVTVKGYPTGTAKTQPGVMAPHWFKDAVFELLVWRGESDAAELAIALPDFPRYRKLHDRVHWLQPVVNWQTIWVDQAGLVTVTK